MSAVITIPVWGRYDQLHVRYDQTMETLWCVMNPIPRPCFNPGILADIKRLQATVAQINKNLAAAPDADPLRYFVATSAAPGVFNLGGDLSLFLRCIREGRSDLLRRYAQDCIDVLYVNSQNIDRSLTTIALVQGEAMGGGFEAAISCSVVIAEESATFALPEVLFNLFPGMGAYSFLSRRITPAITERLILTGEVYTARQMYELGVVDVLAPDGKGEEAVCSFIRRHEKRRNTHAALRAIREKVNPVTLSELEDITEIWVETALRLKDKDLRMMERLAHAQDRRTRHQKGGDEKVASAPEARVDEKQLQTFSNSRRTFSI